MLLTGEISKTLMLPIVFAPRRVIPLNSKPFFLCPLDWTNVSNGTQCRCKRDSLAYIIFWRHCILLLSTCSRPWTGGEAEAKASRAANFFPSQSRNKWTTRFSNNSATTAFRPPAKYPPFCQTHQSPLEITLDLSRWITRTAPVPNSAAAASPQPQQPTQTDENVSANSPSRP